MTEARIESEHRRLCFCMHSPKDHIGRTGGCIRCAQGGPAYPSGETEPCTHYRQHRCEGGAPGEINPIVTPPDLTQRQRLEKRPGFWRGLWMFLQWREAATVHYLSTACLHQRHTECRRTCKFCSASCRCACGHD